MGFPFSVGPPQQQQRPGGATFGPSARLVLLALALVVLSCLATLAHAADYPCVEYHGELCSSIYPPGTRVSPLFSAVANTEIVLLDLGFGNLTSIGAKVDPVCAEAALYYVCTRYMKICDDEFDNGTYVPKSQCHTVCDDYVDQCSDLLNATGAADLIPECPSSSQAGCKSFPFEAELPDDFTCPEPLILNPNPEAENPSCIGYCCVPCPQTHYFYPRGVVDAIDKTVISFAVVSLICAIIVILSYTLMPEKRSYPSVIVLCMAIAMIFIYFPVLFLIGDPNRVRCIDTVTQSVPGHNLNRMCQFQSTFLIFGYLSLVMWFFILVCNIYSSVIFLSKRFQDFKWYFQGLCWGIPWIFVIVAHAMNKTGYSFGISCVIETGSFLNALLLIPIAVLVFPAVLLNLHVLVKIAIVAKRRNASLHSILALQIRSFFFVTLGLMVFLFYWIFIEVNVAPLELDASAPWVTDWFFCVANGGGQDGCARLADGHVPLLAPFAIAEILVYGLGLILFGFFVIKADVLQFWRELLSGNRKRIFEPANSSLGASGKSSNRSAHRDEEGKKTTEMRSKAADDF